MYAKAVLGKRPPILPIAHGILFFLIVYALECLLFITCFSFVRLPFTVFAFHLNVHYS